MNVIILIDIIDIRNPIIMIINIKISMISGNNIKTEVFYAITLITDLLIEKLLKKH